MQYSPVQLIKERLTIEDVVSSYIKLEQSGSNFKAKCPFHNEKTPSFFVSPDRGSYYCFGCSASGDIFSFVQQFEGLDFKGALKLLADKAGVSIGQVEDTKELSDKDVLYKIIQIAVEYFQDNLQRHPLVLKYLKQRGLEDKTIAEFKIGFAEDDWRALYGHLRSKGFSDQHMDQAGLVKRTEKGFYDRFRGRIMFPINDSSGRPIAFSGRIFAPNAPSPNPNVAKYVNSPETLVFKKSTILYGIDKAKDAIRKNNFSILVEGQLDLLLSHQAGFKNTVASSGTALSDSIETREHVVSNLGLIRRLSNNLVLGFDADKAGLSASERAAKIALSLGMDVKVAKLKEGFDPADLILKEGKDSWKEAIRESKPIVTFLANKFIENKKDDKRGALKLIREKVLPYIVEIESALEQAFFVKELSELVSISEDSLRADLSRITKNKVVNLHSDESQKFGNNTLKKEKIFRKLMGILLWQRGKDKQDIKIDQLSQEIERILNISLSEELTNFIESENEMIFEAEVFYDNNKNLKQDIQELLYNLEEETLKEKMEIKLQELKQTKNDKEAEKQILLALQIINNNVQILKKKKLESL